VKKTEGGPNNFVAKNIDFQKIKTFLKMKKGAYTPFAERKKDVTGKDIARF